MDLIVYDIPVKEHDYDEGREVVGGDVGLRVERDKDEDAEGRGEDEHADVPEESGRPVGHGFHAGHELQVLHLAHTLINVEDDEGGGHEAHGEDDADGVEKTYANLATEEKN